MNYIDVYNRITLNRKDLPKETYGEVHHIWPKSLGGGNEPENLVRLTAKEHYIAHHLLTKIFPDCREIVFAFNQMCGRIGAKGVYVSPRVYAEARENAAAAQRGRKASAETRNKIGEAQRGKTLSATHRAKLSAANLGKPKSKEHRAKMSESHKGLHSGSKHPNWGKPSYNRSEQQYIFTHPEHGELTCTTFALRTEFELDSSAVTKLVKGKRKTTGGWRVLEKIKEEIKTNE